MNDSSQKSTVMEEASQRAQKEACFLLFNKFTKEVIQKIYSFNTSIHVHNICRCGEINHDFYFWIFGFQVMQRLQQYKDDLLAACLTFILSLPQEVIVSQIATIVPALKVLILITLYMYKFHCTSLYYLYYTTTYTILLVYAILHIIYY